MTEFWRSSTEPCAPLTEEMLVRAFNKTFAQARRPDLMVTSSVTYRNLQFRMEECRLLRAWPPFDLFPRLARVGRFFRRRWFRFGSRCHTVRS